MKVTASPKTTMGKRKKLLIVNMNKNHPKTINTSPKETENVAFSLVLVSVKNFIIYNQYTIMSGIG